jgi:hypothetical protein
MGFAAPLHLRRRVFVAVLCVAGFLVMPRPAAAAATFHGVMSAKTTMGTRLEVARPSAAVAGDLLVAALDVRISGTRPITAPAGWTLLRRTSNSAAGAQLTQAVYFHFVQSADAMSYAFS